MATPRFFYLECPSCEWDCVIAASETEMGLMCPVCAEDNGRDVYLRGGLGPTPEKVEGYDARQTPEGVDNVDTPPTETAVGSAYPKEN